MRSSVCDPENFRGRVQLAASYIAQGRDVSCNRTFDTCFEMCDGAAVATALFRRVRNNPKSKLAANIWRYLGRSVVEADAARYADVPTRELPALAARLRAEAKAAFEVWLEERDAEDKPSGTGQGSEPTFGRSAVA